MTTLLHQNERGNAPAHYGAGAHPLHLVLERAHHPTNYGDSAFINLLRGRIRIRIDRLSLVSTGDVKAVGEGISELRIEYGPGSQVCFKKTGKKLVLLRCGGNKLSQTVDIETAKRMAKDL
jgi:putative addiction module killer protein